MLERNANNRNSNRINTFILNFFDFFSKIGVLAIIIKREMIKERKIRIADNLSCINKEFKREGDSKG